MGLAVLGTTYVGCFSYQILCVQFGVVRCSLQNFWCLDFQRLLLPLFSSNLTKLTKYGNRRKYRLLLFLVICQILKTYGTLTICDLSYIAISHQLIGWWHLAKVKHSLKAPGPLVFLFSILFSCYQGVTILLFYKHSYYLDWKYLCLQWRPKSFWPVSFW